MSNSVQKKERPSQPCEIKLNIDYDGDLRSFCAICDCKGFRGNRTCKNCGHCAAEHVPTGSRDKEGEFRGECLACGCVGFIYSFKGKIRKRKRSECLICGHPYLAHKKNRLWCIAVLKQALLRKKAEPGRGMPSIQKRMFDRYDRDRDGHISAEEFHNLLQSLGYYLSPEEMEWALKIVDKDGSGCIDFKEFDSFYKSEGRFEKLRLNSETIEKYTEAFADFSKFDEDGSGTMDVEEFVEYIKSLNGLIKTDPRETFWYIDRDKSGTISFNEFVDFVTSTVNKDALPSGFTYSQ